MQSSLSSGAARGRTTTMIATLIALVLASLAPLEALAQGMPVFRDSTEAVRKPNPVGGMSNDRDGLQILLIDPVTNQRSLLPGASEFGLRVEVSNPPQGAIYYYPSVWQNQKRPAGPLYNGALAVPDSTFPVESRGATCGVLWVYPTFDDSTASVVWALSVRSHPQQVSDSLTTFKLFSRKALPTFTTARDTLGSLLEWTQAVTYVDSLIRPFELGPIVMHHTASPRGFGVRFPVEGDFVSLVGRFLNVTTVTANGLAFCGKDPLTTWKADLYLYRDCN